MVSRTAYRDLVTRSKSLFTRITSRAAGGGSAGLAKCMARRPSPLVSGPERFGVLWSGKGGSMAAVFWFLARVGQLDAAREYARNPHNYRIDVLQKSLEYRQWIASCDPRELAWLRILRDPYKRAVSSYRHVLRHGIDDAAIKEQLNISIPESGLSFAEFLEFLERVDIAKCNVHYRQQWHPLEAHVTVRRVVNIDEENLLAALDAFENELGLPPLSPQARANLVAVLSRESRRHHKNLETSVGDQTSARMTRDEADGHWPAYDAFLSDDTRRKLERIYAKDFAAYADIL